jgi:hypothetical protein
VFKQQRHVHEVILDLREKFGPIFTIWFGPKPMVIITELEIAQQAFRDKKIDFNGRQHSRYIVPNFLGDLGTDIVFNTFDRTWEVLRRVAHAATRKYSTSDAFGNLVVDVVDETVATIKTNHDEKAFDPIEYIYLMIFSIIAGAAYGKRYFKVKLW